CDCWHKIHLSQGDGIRLSRNIERFSHPQHVGIGSRTVTARVYQITVRAADCEGSSSSWPITPRLAPARRLTHKQRSQILFATTPATMPRFANFSDRKQPITPQPRLHKISTAPTWHKSNMAQIAQRPTRCRTCSLHPPGRCDSPHV